MKGGSKVSSSRSVSWSSLPLDIHWLPLWLLPETGPWSYLGLVNVVWLILFYSLFICFLLVCGTLLYILCLFHIVTYVSYSYTLLRAICSIHVNDNHNPVNNIWVWYLCIGRFLSRTKEIEQLENNQFIIYQEDAL